MDLKEYDRGIEFYRKALSRAVLDGKLKNLIHLRLGYAYLNKNDLEQAVKFFKKVEEANQSGNQDLASFEIGRIYEKEGKISEAMGKYESVVKGFPASPVAVEASARVTLLKGKGEPLQGSAPATVSPGGKK